MTKEQIASINAIATSQTHSLDADAARLMIVLLEAQREAILSAQKAIATMLIRIKTDEKVRYHISELTQSYAVLTEAYSLLTGQPVEQVRDRIIPDSGALLREL